MEYKIISILYSASLFRHFNLIVNAHEQDIQKQNTHSEQRIIMLLWRKKG